MNISEINPENLTISFRNLEESYECQKDLIRVIQSSLSSASKGEEGWYTLELIDRIADMQFKALQNADIKV